MENKLNVKEIIKVGMILLIITAVLAALLAFVNGKTAPLIEKNALEKEQIALKAVMPDAFEFESFDYADTQKNFAHSESFSKSSEYSDLLSLFESGKIEKYYLAYNDAKQTIGACVITETSGYDIGIQTVTGVDTDLKVTGVEIIAMNETPGLGAKASELSFREQYIGKSGKVGVSKNGASDTEIQAISGATKTSNGVTNGVNIALETAKTLLEGGNE